MTTPLSPERPEVWLYLPAMIVGTALAVGALLEIYQRTRKTLDHPQWGVMTYDGEWWSFPWSPLGDPTALRIELMGTRQGPDPQALEIFAHWQTRLEKLTSQVMPHAREDLQTLHECLRDTREASLTEPLIRQLQAGGPETVPGCRLVALRLWQGRQKAWRLSLDYQMAWDDEHERTASFDSEGRLLHYDLSCTVVDL